MEETPIAIRRMTDDQFERQLLSEEKLRLQELESKKAVELAKIDAARENQRGRRETLRLVLGGGAFVLVVLSVILSTAYGLYQASVREDQIATECVKAGNMWTDNDRGDLRCERP